MIVLVMYGMIPSENTANRVSAPPENRSMNCRAPCVFTLFCSCASAEKLRSGTGTREPIRNTAMIASVNRIFLRRSGILNALPNAFSTGGELLRSRSGSSVYRLDDLDGPAGRLDLGASGARHGMRAHRQAAVHLAPAQDLHRERRAH